MTSRSLSVAVVEDEHLLGDLLGEWIAAQPDLDLVQVCRSVAEARQQLAARHVDVLVVDLQLPDGDGLTLAGDLTHGRVGAVRPRGVVILSGAARPDLITTLPAVLDASWAYLLKGSNTTQRLRQAVDAVASGLVMIDPALHQHPSDARVRFSSLTDMEHQVLAALASGASNRAIANTVHVSVKSVERMLSSIYTKLGLDASDQTTNPRVQAALAFVHRPG
jgi:DNA-binding NarL/FixJ family response regulator